MTESRARFGTSKRLRPCARERGPTSAVSSLPRSHGRFLDEVTLLFKKPEVMILLCTLPPPVLLPSVGTAAARARRPPVRQSVRPASILPRTCTALERPRRLSSIPYSSSSSMDGRMDALDGRHTAAPLLFQRSCLLVFSAVSQSERRSENVVGSSSFIHALIHEGFGLRLRWLVFTNLPLPLSS